MSDISDVALAISVPFADPNWRAMVLQYGLASERSSLSISRVFVAASRSVVLCPGVAAASLQAVLHYSAGMLRIWILVLFLIGSSFLLALPSLLALALVCSLIASSVVVHELGHVISFRLIASPHAHALLVSRGINCSLIRETLPWRMDRLEILSGPLAPLLLTVPLVPIVLVAPILFWAWLSIALGHALFLIVPIGDGENLRATR